VVYDSAVLWSPYRIDDTASAPDVVAASPPDIVAASPLDVVAALAPDVVAASPPDVRRGSAPPFTLAINFGLCPRSGLYPIISGPKAEPRAQPKIFFES